jgi:hypothetical protein
MNDPRQGWTSASNAQADSLCAGRHLAQKGLVSLASEDSTLGNRIHAALHNGTPHNLSIKEQETLDACKTIEVKVAGQFFTSEELQAAKVFREERLWIEFHEELAVLKHSGQVDCCYRIGGKALVIDYKSLMGETPASPRNMQLRDLACLGREHFIFIKQVAVVVIQPWVTHSPELCVYEEKELDQAEDDLFERVKASNDPQSKRTPGELQCRFCLAAKHGKCVEYQHWAGRVFPVALPFVHLPVHNWTPEQRGHAMEALKPARVFLDQIEDSIRQGIAVDPAFCPGWQLSPGQKRESIIDPQKVYERFIALGGSNERFLKAVKVQKGDLREAVNDTTGAKGQALDKALKSITEGCVEVKETQPRLERVKK